MKSENNAGPPYQLDTSSRNKSDPGFWSWCLFIDKALLWIFGGTVFLWMMQKAPVVGSVVMDLLNAVIFKKPDEVQR